LRGARFRNTNQLITTIVAVGAWVAPSKEGSCQQIRAVTLFNTPRDRNHQSGRTTPGIVRWLHPTPAGDQGRGSASAPHRAGSRCAKEKSNKPTVDGADRKSGAAGPSQADEPGPQAGWPGSGNQARQGRKRNTRADQTRRDENKIEVRQSVG
jgi:hypothetical protein